jgi:glutathione-independent formaldehyde dehydrogenase
MLGINHRRNDTEVVVYQGQCQVCMDQVEDPRIERPDDAVIRIATARICGSDLHPYEDPAQMSPVG